jgi:hypothetical protein
MLQTFTTDSEFNLFPLTGINTTPISALSEDEEIFYNSIKEELNQISFDPSPQAIEQILAHSKTL